MWSTSLPATPKPNSKGLPRAAILRKRSEFMAIKENGKRLPGRYLLLNWLVMPDMPCRMAVVVPKKTGTAVERNRIKRQVRESYRKVQSSLPLGVQSVWIARKDAKQSAYGDINDEVHRLYRKANLIPSMDQLS